MFCVMSEMLIYNTIRDLSSYVRNADLLQNVVQNLLLCVDRVEVMKIVV